MEDIVRFRDASKVIAFMIQEFGRTNLFPRENYEFYARITGRTLRVDENWQFTFHVPSTCGFNTLNSRGNKGKNFNNPKLSSGGLMNFRRSVGNIQFDQGIAAAAVGSALVDDPSNVNDESATAAVIVNHCRGSFTKSSAGAVRYTAAAPSSSKFKFYDLCFTTSSFPRYHHHFKGGCYILSSGNRPTCDVQRATELGYQSLSPPPFDSSVPAASTLMRRRTLTPPRSHSSPAQALADSLDDLWNVNKALLPLTLTTSGAVGCAVNAHWSQLCCPYIDDSLQYQPTAGAAASVGSSFVWAPIDDADNGCKANSCEF